MFREGDKPQVSPLRYASVEMTTCWNFTAKAVYSLLQFPLKFQPTFQKGDMGYLSFMVGQ